MRVAAVVVAVLVTCAMPVRAEPVLLSANDGLQVFANGAYRMRAAPGMGTLSAFDLSQRPFRPLWHVPIEQTAVGPPTALATTPDGRLVLIANPAAVDPADPSKIVRTQVLQVVDLVASPPTVSRLALDHHPWSVAVAPGGHLAATANGDGTMTLLRLDGQTVSVIRDVAVGAATSLNTGVAFAGNGRVLLASRRHDDVVTLFRVEGEDAIAVRDLTVGSNPYEIVTTPDGKLAAVSNIGRNSGDHDSVSLIDLSGAPVTVGVIGVGPTPEGLAFSPDSRWLAVNAINGSNLKPGDPFRSDHSLIQLFDLRDGAGRVRLAGSAEVGPNAQGLAFTPDGATLVVQDYAADALALFGVTPSGLVPIHETIPTEGGPSALAVVPLRSTP